MKSTISCTTVVHVTQSVLLAALLVGCDNRPQNLKDAENPVKQFAASNPEVANLYAEFEARGLFRFRCEEQRVYVASSVWTSNSAERKEFLVRTLALECARRRGDQGMTLEVVDMQSGRTLASYSTLAGVKIQ